jgi:hypothetical protein
MSRAAAATPLPVIEVTEPCSADWNAMAGDDRTRFCAHCERHVHDLSAMRSDEVADLFCRSAGSLCVRFERAMDGQVKTLDYARPRGWRHGYKWLVLGVLAALGAGGARTAWQRQATPPPPNMIMGGCPAPPMIAPAPTLAPATNAPR